MFVVKKLIVLLPKVYVDKIAVLQRNVGPLSTIKWVDTFYLRVKQLGPSSMSLQYCNYLRISMYFI